MHGLQHHHVSDDQPRQGGPEHRPARACAVHDPHAIFPTAMALMTRRPQRGDRLQNARHKTPSTGATASAETVFSKIHPPVSFPRSRPWNPSTLGLTRPGAGNRNTLVERAASGCVHKKRGLFGFGSFGAAHPATRSGVPAQEFLADLHPVPMKRSRS
jgi:hypothetical protein